MDIDHTGGIAFIGMVAQARDGTLRVIKDNWAVFSLAATLVAGGSSALTKLDILATRVGALESTVQATAGDADAALREIKEIRRDLRVTRSGLVKR